MTLSRRIVAEGLGTAFLLSAVVGSGIMGERLAGGNTAIALLANTLATGAKVITLIFTFGPISGEHFNPAVTLADASQGGISWSDVPVYIAAQVLGAFIGVATAHLMFGETLLQFSHHPRAGGQLFSGFVATFRAALCHLGLCPLALRGGSGGGRSLHYRRVLVYGFHLLCESGDSAKESCPVFPNQSKRIHMGFEDPAAFQGTEQERLAIFRRVRDEIRDYLKTFPS
jgi:hypothetical protein